MEEKEKKPLAAEKEKSAGKPAAGRKALFKEDLQTVLGCFRRGKEYEIPEKYFSAWEEAGIVEAAKGE